MTNIEYKKIALEIEKNIPIEYLLRMKVLQKKRRHVCWVMIGRVMCGN